MVISWVCTARSLFFDVMGLPVDIIYIFSCAMYHHTACTRRKGTDVALATNASKVRVMLRLRRGCGGGGTHLSPSPPPPPSGSVDATLPRPASGATTSANVGSGKALFSGGAGGTRERGFSGPSRRGGGGGEGGSGGSEVLDVTLQPCLLPSTIGSSDPNAIAVRMATRHDCVHVLMKPLRDTRGLAAYLTTYCLGTILLPRTPPGGRFADINSPTYAGSIAGTSL